jgi:hypothetical protein
LEYLLAVTVSLIIIIGMVYQFSSAFASWMNSFFGSYIACLIETGELPGVSKSCASENIAFNIKNGTDKSGVINGSFQPGGSNGSNGDGGNSSGNGSSGSNGSSSSNNSNNNAASAAAAAAAARAGGGTGSGAAGPEAIGGGRTTPVGSIGDSKRASTAVGSAKDGKPLAGLAAGDSVDGVDGDSSSGRRRKSRLDMGYGYFGQEEDKEKKASKPAVATVAKDSDDGSSLKPKKATEDLSRKPASKSGDEGSGLSYGAILRFILIAVILVVIFVFFGGQIQQIMNSSEK